MVKQERVIAFICGILLAYCWFRSAQRIVNDVQDYLGPRFHGTEQNAPSLNLPSPGPRAADSLRRWNRVRSDDSGLMMTARRSRPEKLACTGEQLGPTRADFVR